MSRSEEWPPCGRRITLCGSTRFAAAFDEWNARLTLRGCIVYSIAVPVHGDGVEVSAESKRLLDWVHLRKIDNSDEIFVLDVDGYVGDSTRGEIDYALKSGKCVRYLSELQSGRLESA